MIASIKSCLTAIMTIGGDVVSAIFGPNLSWGTIAPLICLGVAFSLIGFAIRTIKSLSWGF